MKRSEVFDFLKRDYPEYAWSLPTLDRRMRYFDMKYINFETTVDEVVAAFNTKNDGPGQLFGYRSMHKNLREHHGLAVPRGVVYDVITMPEGLEHRKNVGKKERLLDNRLYTTLAQLSMHMEVTMSRSQIGDDPTNRNA